jgi:D-alanyl-D-alanine carboxypeptidase/D-alanyl-D-alanine-endopeptidase (penicillin-binding protein 4)
LSYNENAAVIRLTPGQPRAAAGITITPPGHLLDAVSEVTTGDAASAVSIELFRFPGRARLVLRGSLPAGNPPVTRTAAVDNPTRFFVEALRLALADRGIAVTGGAWDIDDVPGAVARDRRLIARRQSDPLSSLAARTLKVSQNFYAETLLKTLGAAAGKPGSTQAGREAVRAVLASWEIPPESIVMYDGSGLSRYNYVTARSIVLLLRRMWTAERLRGPFLAALPVAGRDGTLELRMKNTPLDRNLQAKTGTISNVRALSGYLQNGAGEKLVFSMIVNHFTASTADVDAIVERALDRLAR